MNYTTDVWTGCADVLTQFNITLDYFQLANPDIGSNCQNFVPGSVYCVSVARIVVYFLLKRYTDSRGVFISNPNLRQRPVWRTAELDQYLCR